MSAAIWSAISTGWSVKGFSAAGPRPDVPGRGRDLEERRQARVEERSWYTETTSKPASSAVRARRAYVPGGSSIAGRGRPRASRLRQLLATHRPLPDSLDSHHDPLVRIGTAHERSCSSQSSDGETPALRREQRQNALEGVQAEVPPLRNAHAAGFGQLEVVADLQAAHRASSMRSTVTLRSNSFISATSAASLRPLASAVAPGRHAGEDTTPGLLKSARFSGRLAGRSAGAVRAAFRGRRAQVAHMWKGLGLLLVAAGARCWPRA